ncbi:MAG: PaaI family thioesterase [Sphingomicrobium sp.]
MDPLPPYGRLLGLRAEHDGAIRRFAMPFSPDVVGRPGFLHGGAIAGLLEFTAFDALTRALGDSAVVMKPVTVTVDYLRGASEGQGDTFAEASVERLGNRIANIEAMAWQTDRAKPIAAARINFLLERP